MSVHAPSHTHKERKSLVWRLHLDLPLLAGIFLLMGMGLLVLYSASGEHMPTLYRQAIRMGVGLGVMVFVAQFPPRFYAKWAPVIYGLGIALLIAVLLVGDVGKGAQRWLELPGIRFQPSEIMKLAVPLMIAWYFHSRVLPAKKRELLFAFGLTLIPTLLIASQPDLGTSLLIASSGLFVIYLSGVSWRMVFSLIILAIFYAPLHWFYLIHDYQKDRILVYLQGLFNPEHLCSQSEAWQICQSLIAIGSGGIFGKGWLQGTQSQLEFLPERSTDFIFAVLAEEFGLTGVIILVMVYLLIIGRGVFISIQAQETFSRLIAGAITLTFFVYLFVNIGMVVGLLPVVGLPLPLISYGGTSIVTLLAGFGMLMSVRTHRKLVSA